MAPLFFFLLFHSFHTFCTIRLFVRELNSLLNKSNVIVQEEIIVQSVRDKFDP
ncbi:hypothetical protein HanIR_Chr03g0123281 [Helianthus annuus]|nr:hypothetical protein HanIR_Chr03g0123281 [Helianthus annuus]